MLGEDKCLMQVIQCHLLNLLQEVGCHVGESDQALHWCINNHSTDFMYKKIQEKPIRQRTYTLLDRWSTQMILLKSALNLLIRWSGEVIS